VIRNFVASLWTLLMFIGSLLPKAAIEREKLIDIPNLDKIVHFTMYFGFVLLWNFAFQQKRKNVSPYYIFAVSIAFGLIIETLQFWMNLGRNFELYDIIANIIGSILGLIAFYKFFKS